MASFNRVIPAGNLTRDPELRYTPKGTAVGKIGIAVNRTFQSEGGERKEEVTFIDVEAWGRQAEVIGQYFKKGNPILLEGRLKLDSWEDKNTKQKVNKLKVVLENFSFIGTRGAGGGGGGDMGGSGAPGFESAAPRQRAAAPPASAPEPSEPDAAPPDEDDVPF